MSTLYVWKLELLFLIRIQNLNSSYLLQSLEFTQTPRGSLTRSRACGLIEGIKAEDFGCLDPKGLEQNRTGRGELHTAVGSGPSKH